MEPARGAGPLDGIRVVELAGLGPAPFACMLLADLGAEVIRIDRPVAGELDVAPELELLNRGKRSVTLDLKGSDGVEAALALIGRADILVEGFRPGVAERLGLGPDRALARNSALVYGRMTGWGQDGPAALTAGHDISYIAVTGALHAMGEPDGPPQIPLNLVGDFGGGSLYLVVGLLAALHEARRSGWGQVVDAAILDGTLHLLTMFHGMLAAKQWTDVRGGNTLDGGAPFYSVYETSDGRFMAVGALESKFYQELLRVLDLDVDSGDQYEREHWPELRRRIAAAFASRTQAAWIERFAGTDACVSPVLSMQEAAGHPQVAARTAMADVDGVGQPGVAPRFSEHPGLRPGSTAVPGSSTRAVLAEAGLDVERLLADGVASERRE
ncbi:alpha-methylacyl-CoA racemase [Haloechinothrix alba]|uniref:Alpha-methylacyl-CoA racemase n=1 Tax=Haloechinothrix alba TaxID=664784 RepID=A0A239AD70_9PSEU|nr:CaiB/BaiF CoA-transferase family protein [Haloechinothrix alba]SNR92853.1 alpha-methylacyl-CoA racemase [Haloechinothrix alba]